MPSILDLFGTLEIKGAESSDRSLKGVLDRARDADVQLNKVIATSNKLGDTSATVARRYEKLGEGVGKATRLLVENALAFERGEITEKKYQATIESVSRSLEGLTSRIKDAAARATELNETGLTHFQNQIQGAVASTNTLNGLFGNLTRFQKQQLGFQLNDIISGLASGQSPTQILFQQGGQIVQVFQQGKLAQEGLTVATKAAVVAETELVAVSQLNNTTVAASVNQMLAYRKETEGAAAATGILNTSLVSIGAVLAAGVVTILTAKKISEDILKGAQDRLKTEEAIAGAFNKQYQIATDLKAVLTDIAEKGQTDRFLKGFDNSPAGVSSLRNYQAQLQTQLDANLRDVAIASGQRTSEADRLGLTGEVRAKYIEEAIPPGFKEANQKLAEQIKAAASQVESLKTSQPTSREWYENAIKQQQDYWKSTSEAAEQAQKKNEDAAKKAKEAADRAAEAVNRAVGGALQVFASTTDNPFSKLITGQASGYKALQDAFKDVGRPDIQSQLRGLIDESSNRALAGLRIQNALSVLDLTSLADKFKRGTNDTDSIAFYKQALSNPNLSAGDKSFYSQTLDYLQTSEFQDKIDKQISAIRRSGKGSPEEISKSLAALGSTLDPTKLSDQENRTFAQAFRDEAARKANEESEAKKRDEIFRRLADAIKRGAIVKIINKAKDRAEVTTTGSQDDVDQFYQ